MSLKSWDKAKQSQTALSFGLSDHLSLRRGACVLLMVRALRQGGSGYPPLPPWAPHSLPGSLLPDDGLRFHFPCYLFFKRRVSAITVLERMISCPPPRQDPICLIPCTSVSTEGLAFAERGQDRSIFGVEPARNEPESPRKQAFGEMRIQFLFLCGPVKV